MMVQFLSKMKQSIDVSNKYVSITIWRDFHIWKISSISYTIPPTT